MAQAVRALDCPLGAVTRLSARGGALPVIMSIIGPRETHDDRNYNLLGPSINPKTKSILPGPRLQKTTYKQPSIGNSYDIERDTSFFPLRAAHSASVDAYRVALPTTALVLVLAAAHADLYVGTADEW